MVKDYRDKTQIEFVQVYDFIASLVRLSRHKDFIKEREKWDIKPEIELDKWIDTTKKDLDKKEQNILNFFFNKKRSPGSGLMKYIFYLEKKNNNVSIENFIDSLKKIDENKLIYYFTVVSYNGNKKLSPSLIAEWRNKNLYEIINNNFDVSAEDKWKIIKIFNEIESLKKQFVNFLYSYYNKYYKPEEKKIEELIIKHIEQNKENLKRAVYKGITELFSLENNIFSFNQTLLTRITYFSEFGDNGFFEKNLFVVGYKYPKFINKVIPNQENLEEQIHVLKALADKTRLKLLHELKNESKYMTELASKFEISNPSVDYHLKKFLQAGLIKIDKSENRIYYKIKKERINNLIELLKKYFDL